MAPTPHSSEEELTIAIIGLGYVGLSLAVEFGKKMPTFGLDLSTDKVASYRSHIDPTGEVSTQDLQAATHLQCHTDPSVLKDADFIIIAVPTPVGVAHQPDFTPLIKSSETVGKHMKRGAIVVYESTVYPGATEEVCIPVLEKYSGSKWRQDFWVGYSPERINPGDKEHHITNIKKVTSGSTPEIADLIDELYNEIITVGTHKAESIKIAEAAKVIENTQRDLNIALINELALIFNKLGIDTEAVLKAAGTKWNFLPFRPGLVGGHCIGVDPYYLTHKAEAIGYHPQVILAGRRINDGMGVYVAGQLFKEMLKRRVQVLGARVLVLGLTFKENCPDLRNTRVIDVIHELQDYEIQVDVHDPWINGDQAQHEFGLDLVQTPLNHTYDGIILAVAHDEFKEMGAEAIHKLGKDNHVLYDLKNVFDLQESDLRL